MSDEVLGAKDQQEALSRAYVQAVAARAGYTIAQSDFDRDSVDLTVSAGGEMRPRIDVQLKATINLAAKGESFGFALSIKNYNDLRKPTQTPRLLVVLDLPKDESQWMTCTAESLVLRRSAYWTSLRKEKETDNTTNITIEVPRTNRFDVDGLKGLMDASRRGAIG